MSFGEAIQSCLNNYANFSGRARRSEYWYFFLLNVLVGGMFSYLGNNVGAVFYYISYLYSLAVFIPSLAVCWRRLHDTGRSGLRLLLALIPLVGGILLLVWCCQDSQRGANEYGPDPKGEYAGSYTAGQSGNGQNYDGAGKPPWEY